MLDTVVFTIHCIQLCQILTYSTVMSVFLMFLAKSLYQLYGLARFWISYSPILSQNSHRIYILLSLRISAYKPNISRVEQMQRYMPGFWASYTTKHTVYENKSWNTFASVPAVTDSVFYVGIPIMFAQCDFHPSSKYLYIKAPTNIVFHFHDLQRILVSHVICR